MCHMGGPLGYGPYAGKKDEVFANWKASMTDLAKCPNVSVKLGGVTMRLAAYDYGKLPAPPSSEALAGYWGPYVKTCIDLFGPDRCMVESNYPVEKMGIGMPALWNLFQRLTAGLPIDRKSTRLNSNHTPIPHPPPPDVSTLPLHEALPILHGREQLSGREDGHWHAGAVEHVQAPDRRHANRSEEHTSELQSHSYTSSAAPRRLHSSPPRGSSDLAWSRATIRSRRWALACRRCGTCSSA